MSDLTSPRLIRTASNQRLERTNSFNARQSWDEQLDNLLDDLNSVGSPRSTGRSQHRTRIVNGPTSSSSSYHVRSSSTSSANRQPSSYSYQNHVSSLTPSSSFRSRSSALDRISRSHADDEFRLGRNTRDDDLRLDLQLDLDGLSSRLNGNIGVDDGLQSGRSRRVEYRQQTYTQEVSGDNITPSRSVQSQREHNVEYLDPANKTTLLSESSATPLLSIKQPSPSPNSSILDRHLYQNDTSERRRQQLSSPSSGSTTYLATTTSTPATRNYDLDRYDSSGRGQLTDMSDLTQPAIDIHRRIQMREKQITTVRHEPAFPEGIPDLSPAKPLTNFDRSITYRSNSDLGRSPSFRGRSRSPTPSRPTYSPREPPPLPKFIQSQLAQELAPGPIENDSSTYSYTSTNEIRREHQHQPPPKEHIIYKHDYDSKNVVDYGRHHQQDRYNHVEQKPPKQIKELLSTFDDVKVEDRYRDPPTLQLRQKPSHQTAVIEREEKSKVSNGSTWHKEKDVEKINVKSSASGPAVFYPGELFHSEESRGVGSKGKMMQQTKSMSLAKEKKMWQKESGGKKAMVLPLCLPVCCAAPCTIM